MAGSGRSPFAPPPDTQPSRRAKAWTVWLIVGLVILAVLLSLFALAQNHK